MQSAVAADLDRNPDVEMRIETAMLPPAEPTAHPVDNTEPPTKKPRAFVPSETISEASRGRRTDLTHIDTHPLTPPKGKKHHNRDPVFPLQQQRKQYADGGRGFRETRRAISDMYARARTCSYVYIYDASASAAMPVDPCARTRACACT